MSPASHQPRLDHESAGAKPGPGRPRDAGADTAILDATLAVIAAEGYTGFSMDAVASRAGVSKATIYRRWPSKQDLVIAAAAALSQTSDGAKEGLRAFLEKREAKFR